MSKVIVAEISNETYRPERLARLELERKALIEVLGDCLDANEKSEIAKDLIQGKTVAKLWFRVGVGVLVHAHRRISPRAPRRSRSTRVASSASSPGDSSGDDSGGPGSDSDPAQPPAHCRGLTSPARVPFIPSTRSPLRLLARGPMAHGLRGGGR